MKYLLYIILTVSINCNLFGYQSKSIFTDFNSFFNQYVEEGRVNYQILSKDKKVIATLSNKIKLLDTSELTKNEEKALLINAYNFFTIKGIIDNYPTTSVMKISGFFKEIKYNIGGRYLSLDGIEKDILMKKHYDPRLHFVLVCGAVSCPPLASYSFQPDILEKQIQTRTELAINDPEFIRQSKGKVEVSKIFEWYSDDFNNGRIIEYINKYRERKFKLEQEFSYYEYNWDLNH